MFLGSLRRLAQEGHPGVGCDPRLIDFSGAGTQPMQLDTAESRQLGKAPKLAAAIAVEQKWQLDASDNETQRKVARLMVAAAVEEKAVEEE